MRRPYEKPQVVVYGDIEEDWACDLLWKVVREMAEDVDHYGPDLFVAYARWVRLDEVVH